MRGVIVAIALTVARTVIAAPANDGTSITPLAPEEERALRAIRRDPPPTTINNNIHYIVSDELRHDLYGPALKARGGVFIGVGTNQNYAMAGWVRPDLLVLLDFDQVIVDLHKAYRIAFLTAKDAAAFIDLWSEANAARFESLVRTVYSKARDRWGARRAHRFAHRKVHGRLKMLRRREKASPAKTFLTDPAQYAFIARLFRTNRVVMVRGDLTAKRTMRELAATLKRFKRVVRFLYLSNAEQYFKFDRQYRANVLRLPTDSASVVLRTRAWKDWPKHKDRGGKRPPNYTYIVQSYENFRLWMKARHIKGLRNLVPWNVLRKDALYTLDRPPPVRRKRGKRR